MKLFAAEVIVVADLLATFLLSPFGETDTHFADVIKI